MTKLEQIDARIKEVESTLVYLLHERLALVNAKRQACLHSLVLHPTEMGYKCTKCGHEDIV